MFKIVFLFLYALQLGVPFNHVMASTGVANTLAFMITFETIMLCFYCAAIAVSFRAYREFKGMFEDSNMQKSGFMAPFEYGSVKDSNV